MQYTSQPTYTAPTIERLSWECSTQTKRDQFCKPRTQHIRLHRLCTYSYMMLQISARLLAGSLSGAAGALANPAWRRSTAAAAAISTTHQATTAKRSYAAGSPSTPEELDEFRSNVQVRPGRLGWLVEIESAKGGFWQLGRRQYQSPSHTSFPTQASPHKPPHTSLPTQASHPTQNSNPQQWAAGTISPQMAEQIDRSNSFPKDVDLWREMGAFGLLGESRGIRACFALPGSAAAAELSEQLPPAVEEEGVEGTAMAVFPSSLSCCRQV